jgi:hypothetical protein
MLRSLLLLALLCAVAVPVRAEPTVVHRTTTIKSAVSGHRITTLRDLLHHRTSRPVESKPLATEPIRHHLARPAVG